MAAVIQSRRLKCKIRSVTEEPVQEVFAPALIVMEHMLAALWVVVVMVLVVIIIVELFVTARAIVTPLFQVSALIVIALMVVYQFRGYTGMALVQELAAFIVILAL
jgi:hypothetical protein